MEEIIKPYFKYPNYLVSNLGYVKNSKGQILKGSRNENGYQRIAFWKNGRSEYYYLHRVILETFLPCENMNKLEVNHIDGNKNNNCLSNLEWVTSAENSQHARDKLKIKYSTEKAHEAAKRKVKMTNLITNEITFFDSVTECANALNLSFASIELYLKEKKPHKKKQVLLERVPRTKAKTAEND